MHNAVNTTVHLTGSTSYTLWEQVHCVSWTGQIHCDVNPIAADAVERDFTPPVTPAIWGWLTLPATRACLTCLVTRIWLALPVTWVWLLLMVSCQNYHLQLNSDTVTFIVTPSSRYSSITHFDLGYSWLSQAADDLPSIVPVSHTYIAHVMTVLSERPRVHT